MEQYVFFRDGFFYPIGLTDDEDAKVNAECNPGTIRVERLNGDVVWRSGGLIPPNRRATR